MRQRLRGAHGGVAVHETFEALLERSDLDAVLVFADNRASTDLGVRALGRGLPVMLEKPMAADLSHRGGHAGPREYGCSPEFVDWLYDPRRNGAGALVDYCGYGALLCRLLLGRPHAVTASVDSANPYTPIRAHRSLVGRPTR